MTVGLASERGRRSPVAATPRHCAWLFATRARRDQPSAGPKKIAKQQAKVRERLAELEQLQRLTVGRVLKIIQLSAACMHRGLHLDDEPDFFSFFSFFLFSFFFFFFTPILFLVVFAPDDLPGPPLSGVGLLATGAVFLATGAAFTSCDIFHHFGSVGFLTVNQ